MTLQEALDTTGLAEATLNGRWVFVEIGQSDYSPSEPDGEPTQPKDISLVIGLEALPPDVTEFYNSVEEITSQEIYKDLDWQATEREEM